MKTVLVLVIYLIALCIFVWAFFWTRRKVWRWQERQIIKRGLPKGVRPKVRLTIDGVKYDVTEGLIKGGLNDKGLQMWYIVGPAHVRFTDPDNIEMFVEMSLPTPKETYVEVPIIGPPGDARFRTADEIRSAL